MVRVIFVSLSRLLTLFSGPQCLPPNTVFRVWDALFSEGLKVVFRIALALLRRAGIEDKDEGLEGAHGRLKKALNEAFDHNELLKEGFRIRGFSREVVHGLRKKNWEEERKEEERMKKRMKKG